MMKSSKRQQESAFLRRLSVGLLLLSWFAAIASLVLGSVGMANHHRIMARLGACVGLSATALLAPPLVWLAVQTYRGRSFATKGTHFPRWAGAAACLLSVGMIISTVVVTSRNSWRLRYKANVAILTLCLISGVSLLLASLVIILRPKTENARRPSLCSSELSSVEMFKTRSILSSSPSSGSSSTTPKTPAAPKLQLHVEYPARCQSVQRKKVDYFAYLFDDSDERYAPSLNQSESHIGHGGSASPSDRPDFEISIGNSPWEIMTPHPLALAATPSLVSLSMPPMPARAARAASTDPAATARSCESPDHFTLDLGSF